MAHRLNKGQVPGTEASNPLFWAFSTLALVLAGGVLWVWTGLRDVTINQNTIHYRPQVAKLDRSHLSRVAMPFDIRRETVGER